jgi:steroid 5-alpha reductase family enzyme
MGFLLKALVALVVGVIVAYIVGKICAHFSVDTFWGWIAGVIAGLAYFLRGPEVV